MLERASARKIQDKLTDLTIVQSIDPVASSSSFLSPPQFFCRQRHGQTGCNWVAHESWQRPRPMVLVLLTIFATGCSLTAAESASWSKVLLTDAVGTGATCLGGSPGGPYLRKGDPKRWIAFHQGGGWCSSDQNCAERSTNNLGSSNGQGQPRLGLPFAASCSHPLGSVALPSSMLCNAGSWTGNVSQPVTVGTNKISPPRDAQSMRIKLKHTCS